MTDRSGNNSFKIGLSFKIRRNLFTMLFIFGPLGLYLVTKIIGLTVALLVNRLTSLVAW